MMCTSPLRKFTPYPAPHIQSLAALLERDAAFARLAPDVEHMVKIAADLAGLLPTYLAPQISSGPLREGVLTLFAAHSALAARLRHLEPSLIQDLQRRGWAVHTLKIRIRPRAPAAQPAPKAARISSTGLSCLDALRQQLAPSPLRMALARLIDRHRSHPLPSPES